MRGFVLCSKGAILLLISLIFQGGSLSAQNLGLDTISMLWIRSDSVALDISGNQVDTIYDLSPNHFRVIPQSPKCFYIPSVPILNFHPSLSFTGNQIYGFPMLNLGPEYSIFMVLKKNVSYTESLSGQDYGEGYLYSDDYHAASGVYRQLGFATPTAYYIESTVREGAEVYRYENFLADGFTNTFNPSVSMKIRYLGGEPGYSLKGEIIECIVIDSAVSTPTRKAIENYLHNKYAPPVSLGPDIFGTYGFCPKTIDAGPRFISYRWSTGDTTSSIAVSKDGEYWVEVTDVFNMVSRDTIKVHLPNIDYHGKDSICAGLSRTWNTGLRNSEYDFNWNDNSTDSLLVINTPGSYFVTVTDTLGCAVYSDTVDFVIDNFSNVTTLGPDTQYCYGSVLALKQGAMPGNQYMWSTGDTADYTSVTTGGAYWVHVINKNGCVADDTIQVTLSGYVATVGFSNGLSCDGKPVSFSDQSVSPTGASIIDWDWNFGDQTSSAAQNPSHVFPDTGSYSIRLIVTTNQGCVSALTKQITVHSNPVVKFVSSNSCEKAITTFFNSTSSFDPISTYHWDFGVTTLQNDTSNLQSPAYSFAETGEYWVSQTVASIYGCTDTLVKKVIVNPKPVSNFTTTPLCAGAPTIFSDSSIIAFPWSIIPGTVKYDFGDGFLGTEPTMAHAYSDTGTYQVTYLFTASNGCRDTVVKTIHVYAIPVVSFTNTTLCSDQPAVFTSLAETPDDLIKNWSWTIGQGEIGHDSVIVYVPDTTGNFVMSHTVKTREGCTKTDTRTISVHSKPVAEFATSGTRGNPPATLAFTNQSSGASTYLFDFGDGSSVSQGFPASHVYNAPGDFDLSLVAITSFGCSDTAFAQFLVLEKHLDVAINSLYYNVKDSFLTVTAEFVNLSTTDISDLEMILQVQDGSSVLDKLPAVMRYQGAPYIHTFSAIKVSSENRSFCVSSRNPNKEADMKPENNLVCRSISEAQHDVVLYPNPVSESVNFEVHSAVDDVVRIKIMDSRGRVVQTERSFGILKGFNRLSMDLSQLEKGLYQVNFYFGDGVILKKIIKE